MTWMTSSRCACQAGLLAQLADDMEFHAGRCDPRTLAQADRAFHLGMVACAGPRVRALAEELAARAEGHCLRHLSRAQAAAASSREHRQILASALEQDAEECVLRVVDHHLRTVTDLVAEIAPRHPLERVRIAALQATGHEISALDAA
jgi:DNA-binding GntR family transcriptional regulator